MRFLRRFCYGMSCMLGAPTPCTADLVDVVSTVPKQVQEGKGVLPLEGSIPDMHATTE